MQDKNIEIDLLTAAKYAKRNGKSVSAVKAHIASGKIPAKQIDAGYSRMEDWDTAMPGRDRAFSSRTAQML